MPGEIWIGYQGKSSSSKSILSLLQHFPLVSVTCDSQSLMKISWKKTEGKKALRISTFPLQKICMLVSSLDVSEKTLKYIRKIRSWALKYNISSRLEFHCQQCEKKKNQNPRQSKHKIYKPIEKESFRGQNTPNSVCFISWDKWLKHTEGLSYQQYVCTLRVSLDWDIEKIFISIFKIVFLIKAADILKRSMLLWNKTFFHTH